MPVPGWSALRRWLARPVDGASIAVFRIGFGLVVAYVLGGFIWPGVDGRSGIEQLYTGPETQWHFPYPQLAWLRPLPEPVTTALFYVATVAAVLVALGWRYRLASGVLLATFTYIWLMDASLYGNHFPLAWVFLVCLAMIPAGRVWSIDAWRSRRRGQPLPATVPWWAVLLLRVQTGLVYFYGGVAKLHPDWFAGEPLRMWLSAEETVAPVRATLGREAAQWLHDRLSTEAAAWFFSYGGLAFDLSIAFLLAWPRTRIIALVLATAFHTFNFVFLAHVGIVAVMAFWATLIFCRPDWPRRFLRRRVANDAGCLGWSEASTQMGRLAAVILCAWLVFQILWPLRHFTIAGDAYWTDEGTRASWFLMTRNKTGALAQFRAVDPAIHIVATADGPQIDWTPWKGMRPPVEIIEVDARRIDWKTVPEIFTTYEPLVGERIFFNPQAAGLSTLGASQARVNEIWRRRFNRRPELTATELLPRILDELAADAMIGVRNKRPDAVAYLRLLAVARTREKELVQGDLNEQDWRDAYLAMLDTFGQLAALQDYRNVFLAGVARAAPLALQGNSSEGFRPLLLGDSGLIASGRSVVWRIHRDAWQGSLPTYSDLRYLEARWLLDLPSVVALIDRSGQASFLWNYTHELNSHQIQALELLPPLAHPLAEHIADWWQRNQGRRPQVFGSSLVALNRRPLLPALDPQVNILAEPYHMLRHNRWITLRPSQPMTEAQTAPRKP